MTDSFNSQTYCSKTPCGNLYTHVLRGEDESIWGLFGNGAKNGTCSSCVNEAINRLITLALRAGRKKITEADIIKSLKGIRCTGADNDTIISCPHAAALALEADVEKFTKEEEPSKS